MVIGIKQLYDKVYEHVKTVAPVDMADALVGYREGNFVGEYGPKGYLWDTPHGNWTGSASVEPGHSDAFAEKIKAAIGKAETFVDITTMKMPDGKFWEAIKAGIVEIAKNENSPHVRIVIGFPVDYDPPKLLDKLMEIVAALHRQFGSKVYLTVDLGTYRYFTSQTYPEGWNHSKIIAVDGKTLITGGHNLWDEDYLGLSPVFDLSLKVEGPIARGGHAFADWLWAFVDKYRRRRGTDFHRLKPFLMVEEKPDGFIPYPRSLPSSPVGNLRAMWVTMSGRGVFKNDDKEIHISTMQVAFREALKTASHCRISQQSFGSHWVNWSGGQFEIHRHDYLPFRVIYHKNRATDKWHAFNYELMASLAEFLIKNQNRETFALEILMSPADSGSYTNQESEVAILDILAWLFTRMVRISRPEIVALMNRLVKLCWPAITSHAGVAQRRWAASDKPMFTHAKFWMLDDRMFYVGSENMYPSLASRGLINPVGGLQEFGVILEADDEVRKLVVDQYHGLAMKYSFRRQLREADLSFNP